MEQTSPWQRVKLPRATQAAGSVSTFTPTPGAAHCACGVGSAPHALTSTPNAKAAARFLMLMRRSRSGASSAAQYPLSLPERSIVALMTESSVRPHFRDSDDKQWVVEATATSPPECPQTSLEARSDGGRTKTHGCTGAVTGACITIRRVASTLRQHQDRANLESPATKRANLQGTRLTRPQCSLLALEDAGRRRAKIGSYGFAAHVPTLRGRTSQRLTTPRPGIAPRQRADRRCPSPRKRSQHRAQSCRWLSLCQRRVSPS